MAGETIHIFGDAAVDHFIHNEPSSGESKAEDENWRNFPRWRLWQLPGGAALVEQFLRSFGFNVRTAVAGGREGLKRSLVELTVDLHDPSAARVERFGGYAEPTGDDPPFALHESIVPAPCDAIVLDDPGNRLRRQSSLWTSHLCPALAPLILHKINKPLARGELWRKLADRTTRGNAFYVVAVSAEDLRRQGLDLSRRLSWDKTLEDLRRTLRDKTAEGNFLVEMAVAADALLIVFDCDGVAVITDEGATLTLVYDPSAAEGDWQARTPGRNSARLSCLCAYLLNQLVPLTGSIEPVALYEAVKTSLGGLRSFVAAPMRIDDNGGLSYPALAAEPEPAATRGLSTFGPVAMDRGERILIVNELASPTERARHLVRHGLERLANVPSARFRNLYTVDRNEIEAYRAIADLIQRHRADVTATRPLSIAVFGPPGSGKSFGVKEIAADGTAPFEINLSQAKEDDLPIFFHEVRDSLLSGRRPLCFFDEFDCQGFRFLSRFLAPMQDGVFHDRGRSHPIGPAIFVFAGGVRPRFRDFFLKVTEKEAEGLKGDDFVSRLSGFIDIRGPDPDDRDGEVDRAFVLRRAILLRSLLERRAPSLVAADGNIAIEDAVLDAFLVTSKFKHGARSIQRLLEMSEIGPSSRRLSIADLPSSEQLQLHVDAAEFEHILRSRQPDVA